MRYEVREGSVSGHCCFEASVIDLENQYDVTLDDEVVRLALCETFDIEVARRIARALNEADERWSVKKVASPPASPAVHSAAGAGRKHG